MATLNFGDTEETALSWVELHEKDPSMAIEAMKTCIVADEFLLRAVEAIGVDWCIHRLKEVKRKKGKVKKIIDIVMDVGKPVLTVGTKPE